MFAPIAARFVLVDTEGWFWIRTVGAPRDGDPRDGELHQSTREGATCTALLARRCGFLAPTSSSAYASEW
jgi:hypothetical protein